MSLEIRYRGFIPYCGDGIIDNGPCGKPQCCGSALMCEECERAIYCEELTRTVCRQNRVREMREIDAKGGTG